MIPQLHAYTPTSLHRAPVKLDPTPLTPLEASTPLPSFNTAPNTKRSRHPRHVSPAPCIYSSSSSLSTDKTWTPSATSRNNHLKSVASHCYPVPSPSRPSTSGDPTRTRETHRERASSRESVRCVLHRSEETNVDTKESCRAQPGKSC